MHPLEAQQRRRRDRRLYRPRLHLPDPWPAARGQSTALTQSRTTYRTCDIAGTSRPRQTSRQTTDPCGSGRRLTPMELGVGRTAFVNEIPARTPCIYAPAFVCCQSSRVTEAACLSSKARQPSPSPLFLALPLPWCTTKSRFRAGECSPAARTVQVLTAWPLVPQGEGAGFGTGGQDTGRAGRTRHSLAEADGRRRHFGDQV